MSTRLHIKCTWPGQYRRGDVISMATEPGQDAPRLLFRVTDTPTLYDVFVRRLYWWERLGRWFASFRRAL